MMVWLPLQLFASHGTEEGKLNISEIVLGHLSDDYEWHIASYEGKSISIPLPIIVRSSVDILFARGITFKLFL